MANENMMGLAAPAGMEPQGAMQEDPAMMAQEQQAPQEGQGGAVDTKQIEAAIEVPPNLKQAFDRVVLSGMRIMFSKDSHKLLLEQLNKEGPLAQKLTEGIISLMYLLWTQSNKTIPPQLMVPATVVLTLRAFDYLQQAGDPEATKEVLGEALNGAVTGVMERFGVDPNNLQGALQEGAQGAQAAPQGAPGGLAAPAGPAPAQPAAPQPSGGIMGMGA
jgi:hypothetical protein